MFPKQAVGSVLTGIADGVLFGTGATALVLGAALTGVGAIGTVASNLVIAGAKVAESGAAVIGILADAASGAAVVTNNAALTCFELRTSIVTIKTVLVRPDQVVPLGSDDWELVVAPEVAAPEVAAPEVVAPEVAAPEVAAPEVAAPEVAAPEVVAQALARDAG